ncbi:MAG: TonB-dependent receptor, partial [Alphaproteobacteria bacterium]|nr:TonB-dependent receptor [Alphaproteobacteria bacterium]
GAEAPPAVAPRTGAGGPPQGARGPGAGARQQGSFGRWSVSVYYRSRLKDEVTLANGLAPIDVSGRGGIDATGATTDGLEFEGGFFYRGMGLRMGGSWTESFETPTVGGGRLTFSDRFSANARLFVNLAAMPRVVEKAPLLLKGARVSLAVDNLTDSFVEVRDQTGATPLAYQEGYQNPTGRTIQLSYRKQF